MVKCVGCFRYLNWSRRQNTLQTKGEGLDSSGALRTATATQDCCTDLLLQMPEHPVEFHQPQGGVSMGRYLLLHQQNPIILQGSLKGNVQKVSGFDSGLQTHLLAAAFRRLKEETVSVWLTHTLHTVPKAKAARNNSEVDGSLTGAASV